MSRGVCVTGATGFIGRAVVDRLQADGRAVVQVARCERGNAVGIGDIGPCAEWRHYLAGMDTVVHLAGRAHVMSERSADPEARFMAVNAGGTERLARQAAAAGVRRLVFVSSIKVNGESAVQPFSEKDPPRPGDAYARSKAEAERLLWQVAAETGLEVVIIRPPLVYGPSAGGNLRRLLLLVAKGVPIPLAAVRNRRSMLGRTNLADFIAACIDHPLAADNTFLLADVDFATPELIRAIAHSMGRPDRMFPFPPRFLKLLAAAVGQAEAVERLCGSLLVDAGKARSVLGWKPPISPEEELEKMVLAFSRATRTDV